MLDEKQSRCMCQLNILQTVSPLQASQVQDPHSNLHRLETKAPAWCGRGIFPGNGYDVKMHFNAPYRPSEGTCTISMAVVLRDLLLYLL